MADRAIELLNEYLKIFNVSAGEYLKLVGDSTKTTPIFSTEVKINDIDTGSISNPLEYTRRLSDFFIEQLDLREAKEDWLDFLGNTIYNIERRGGESDVDYSARIIFETTAVRCTPLAILEALEDYGDNNQIIEGGVGGAFSEVSFANCYRNFNISGQDVVRAAITMNFGGSPYFFMVIMENVDPANYKLIINIIDNYKAAGISYMVVIE